MAGNDTCSRYGFDADYPGVSCADICPASHGKQSGYYIVKTGTVYCDMELECGGHKGG